MAFFRRTGPGTERGGGTRSADGIKAAAAALAAALLVAMTIDACAGRRDSARADAKGGRSASSSVETEDCPKELGRLLILELPSSPFPHRERSSGYRYEGDDYGFEAHYDDPSVSVFLPADFKPGRSIDIVVFFHGWLSSRSKAAEDFSLLRQFKDSGARAILVIPETAKDSPDSFGGKLEDRGGFERFVRDLLAALRGDGVLRSARPGRIVLAGHSGAYRVISRILTQEGLSSHVEEVYLFDALFGGENEFRDWIRAKGKRFVYVLSEGGGTEESARSLARSLEDSGVEAKWAQDDPAEDSRDFASRVLFVTSPSDHYGVVHDRNEFERLLEWSKAIGRR